jgi:hypothetical protein
LFQKRFPNDFVTSAVPFRFSLEESHSLSWPNLYPSVVFSINPAPTWHRPAGVGSFNGKALPEIVQSLQGLNVGFLYYVAKASDTDNATKMEALTAICEAF